MIKKRRVRMPKKMKRAYECTGDVITYPFLYSVRSAEMQHLYAEQKLFGASERARRTKARLWSVDDGTLRYFKFFPRPVRATTAFKDFMKGAVYADIPEGGVVEVFPVGFEVRAWDARHVRCEDRTIEGLREWTEHPPFDKEAFPKATFVAAVWMP